jgi:hypothetical protein
MGEKNAEGKLIQANDLIKAPKKTMEKWQADPKDANLQAKATNPSNNFFLRLYATSPG